MKICRHCVSKYLANHEIIVIFHQISCVNSIHLSIHRSTHRSIHPYLHTYKFVVVNLDALAQASDFRIERRQIFVPCGMQDSKLGSLRRQIANTGYAHSRTDWAIGDQGKLELDSPSLWWASTQHPWLHCRLVSHLALAIYMFVAINRDALAQTGDFQIKRRQVVIPCRMLDSKRGSLRHQITSRLNAHSQTDWAFKNQTKLELDAVSGHVYRYRPAWCEVYIMNNTILVAFLKSQWIVLPLDQRVVKIYSDTVGHKSCGKFRGFYYFYMISHVWIEFINPSIHPPVHPYIHIYIHDQRPTQIGRCYKRTIWPV